MRTPQIRYCRPALEDAGLRYVAEAAASAQLAGGGAFTRRCCAWLQRELGLRQALLTHSGTGALELAAQLCGLEPGDEVIMPAFTFVSTAAAFVRQGARPVFVDVSEDTLNLDAALVEPAISPQTRAVCAVHYAGIACDMDALLAVAREHELIAVEDAAHALGATYRGQVLGAIGDVGCYSFHATKNVSSGEGGAVAVNRKDWHGRAETLWDKGTNRQQFLRGEIERYSWVDIGSSYAPSELVAAFLLAQLEACERITQQRRMLFARYCERLGNAVAHAGGRIPTVPAGCEPNGHIFYLLLADRQQRDALIAHLARHGVEAVFHYVPLHTSPMGRRLGNRPGQLPVTESVSERIVRLPLYPDLTDAEQDRIVEVVTEFLN